MKKYENEMSFVNMFAKDAKESLRNGQKFEAEWNNVTITVTSMDNNNPSKVTMYECTINGVAFKGNITQLKKRLNIAWTKEYNRTGERAQAANTKLVLKSDSELAETAKTANERIMQAISTLRKYSDKYQLGMTETFVGIESVEALILQSLQRERENAKKALEEREAKEAKEREEREREAAKKEEQKATLLAKIAEASASGKMNLVIDLSKELAKLK